VADLSGRVALVTGAGIGIGQGIALALAAAGATVMVHYAHSEAGAQTTVATIRERGGTAECIHGDLRFPTSCRTVVDTTITTFGGLGILVNNSGVTRVAPFTEMSEETYDELFDLNMKGYFFCAQAAAIHMRNAGWGRILNISSVHGHSGARGHTAYAGTKGAVSAFTRALAVELGPDNIRVNCIAPGAIEVPRFFDMPDYDKIDPFAWGPVGRVGMPTDIGAAAVFLVSEGADYVTGQTLYVDGGLTSRLGL